MSKIQRLIDNYNTHISVPWREVAPAQRVIFCVYPENDELKLQAMIEEFEIKSRNHDHGWIQFDLTNTFAKWITSLKYARSYYQKPNLISSVIEKYGDYIYEEFEKMIQEKNPCDKDVIALTGVSTIFGFLKVSDLVERFSQKVAGRLVVFFPGSYENNKYSLLDAYDGWDYHAFAITCDKEIL